MSKLNKLSRAELDHHVAQHKAVLDMARRMGAVIDDEPATKSLKRIKDGLPKLVERTQRDIYKLEAAIERSDRKANKSAKRSAPKPKPSRGPIPPHGA